MIRVVEAMTFNSYRQEAWNDSVVETLTYSSFRQDAWNDKIVETMIFTVSDKKPRMIVW